MTVNLKSAGIEFSNRGLAGANLEHARDHNQRVTLQAIRLNGPLTRTDLASITGLTLPSVANITKRLIGAGLITEETVRRGNRGQPAKQIAIDPDGCCAFGINIDRDHVSLAVIDFAGRVRARASEDVSYALPGEVVALVARHLPSLLRRAKLTRRTLIGAGVAMPDELGRLELPDKNPDRYRVWQTTDIQMLLSKAIALPIFVENDAASAAIGELQFGDGALARSFFYIFIGIGLGGGLVLNGKSYRGDDGRSGELGLMPISSANRREKCLADVVSLSALRRRLAGLGRGPDHPATLENPDAAMAAVIDVWLGEAVNHLAEAIVAIACLVNPDTIFVGGRLPLALTERLCSRLNEAVSARAPLLPVLPVIRVAARAEDAAVLGAAVLPIVSLLLPTEAALLKVDGDGP